MCQSRDLDSLPHLGDILVKEADYDDRQRREQQVVKRLHRGIVNPSDSVAQPVAITRCTGNSSDDALYQHTGGDRRTAAGHHTPRCTSINMWHPCRSTWYQSSYRRWPLKAVYRLNQNCVSVYAMFL